MVQRRLRMLKPKALQYFPNTGEDLDSYIMRIQWRSSESRMHPCPGIWYLPPDSPTSVSVAPGV